MADLMGSVTSGQAKGADLKAAVATAESQWHGDRRRMPRVSAPIQPSAGALGCLDCRHQRSAR